ncbi:MAG: nucleoside 2-deoxyribosyltransferase [Nitrososphaerota archaeon]|nr:nucleoside 2-deoxyribosyltransferase [Nitrososphaerota archaeon]
MQLYIAGPFGFTECGRYFYYRSFLPTLRRARHTIIDPWRLVDEAHIKAALALPPGPHRLARLRALNALIGENNSRAIRASDAIVAILDGSDVDPGTASEIGYAYALKKRIIGYRNDLRIIGENEATQVSLQVEYFIIASGGTIVRTVSEVVSALKLCKVK